MKKCMLLFAVIMCGFARLPYNIDYIDDAPMARTPQPGVSDRVFIAPVGDIRAVLGPQGKNIVVCQHGDVLAVIYGDPTNDPTNNPMEIKIAYSLDTGYTWTTYGPFSPELRRTYPSVDGSPNFCTNPGELYFAWQEFSYPYSTWDIKVMIEEGTPSAPALSTPISLPHAADIWAWSPCIAVKPEDPHYVIVTARGSPDVGNYKIYCWISTDGGYTWSDTIPVTEWSLNGASGHLRWGAGGYAFITYHDSMTVNDTLIEYPYYIESTDAGYTWGQPQPLPVPYVTDTSQFWWTELDCEVINNEPWAVHGDLGTDSIWVFRGVGSPGNWTWEVFNYRQLGAEWLWVGDTLYYCYPAQYPNMSYEPTTNTILVSSKYYYYKGNGAGWSELDGPHIGGMYTTDNGMTWTVSGPLSEPNNGQISWNEWSATEVAHRLACVNNNVYSYAIWVQSTTFDLYYELGNVKPFCGTGIHESSGEYIPHARFSISPTVTNNTSTICMVLSSPAQVLLTLYDVTGRQVAQVYKGSLGTGTHTLLFDASRHAPGVYFMQADIQGRVCTKKIVITRN